MDLKRRRRGPVYALVGAWTAACLASWLLPHLLADTRAGAWVGFLLLQAAAALLAVVTALTALNRRLDLGRGAFLLGLLPLLWATLLAAGLGVVLYLAS